MLFAIDLYIYIIVTPVFSVIFRNNYMIRLGAQETFLLLAICYKLYAA